MTIATFKANRITAFSRASGPEVVNLRKFTGDQSKVSLHTFISFGTKAIEGHALQIDLDQHAIENTVRYLLEMPMWQERIRAMVEATDEAMKADFVDVFDLNRAIQKALDKLDKVCRTPNCHHTTHPELAPEGWVKPDAIG